MKIKLYISSIGALMVFCAILTTVNCYTGSKKRRLNKAFGFTPKFKTNDAYKLLELVLNDADLIKMAAYRQLKSIYKENSENKLNRKKLYAPIIQSAAELVRYYGAVTNLVKLKQSLCEGKHYTAKCLSAMTDPKIQGECLKWKAVLLEAYFFSHSLASNRLVKKWYKNAFKKAKSLLGDDPHLEYLNIKMACKIKLKAQSKSNTPKKSTFLLGTITNELNLDCVSKLLHYKDSFHNYESYTGEYYNLVGQTLAKDGKNAKALEYFNLAREAPVVDQKSRKINKQVQIAIENLYLRERSTKNIV